MMTAEATKRAIFWLIVSVSVAAVVATLRLANKVTHGLRAEYFAGDLRPDAPAARPTLTVVDPDVSTEQIRADWLDPPAAFRVRWFGFLTVGGSGPYTFATASVDGSSVSIDGHLVVDNGGIHTATTRSGTIWLNRGPHAVFIEYAQSGGPFEMHWLWAPGGARLTPVPGWVLTPVRVDYGRIALARFLDWLWFATATPGVVVGLVLAVGHRRAIRAGVRRRPRTASLALFIALAIAETWPLAAHPGRLSRNDNGDAVLNEWVLAWVAHEAPRAPLHLYDANIFYPERDTLAFSEALIVQSAMGAPFLWMGASPVLTYNVVLLAGFALTGWTMSLVVARWTGDWAAGIVSGILLAFNAHTLTRLPHLQAQHVEFLPLALLALDALLREPRAGDAVRLALWFTLQALTSVYLFAFAAAAMVAATLARPEDWLGRRLLKLAPYVLLAAGLAATALLPFMLPYWHAYRDQGLSRSLEDAAAFSATWQDYLSTPSRFHYAWWSHRWFSGTALFPGAVGLVLTVIAIVHGVAFTDARARMCLAVGVAGVALSFGTNLPGYATLYRIVPLLQSIRAVVRFGYLGIVAVAAVSGFAVVEIRRRLPARGWPAFCAALLTLAALDPLVAPVWFARYDGISPIYERLRSEPSGAIVVELPFYDSRTAFAHAKYMLNSTAHWRPVVNGYSGFQPPSFYRNADVLSGFPNPESLAALQTQGVTHVFVHLDEFPPEAMANLDRIRTLHKVAQDGNTVLFRLDRRH